MKKLVKFFFEGLLVIVPIVASVYIVYILFLKIDGILGLSIPGLGFVATIAAITFVGILASNFFTKRLVRLLERLFARLPLVKIFYSSIKDLIGAFVGDKKSFDKPVVVTLDETSECKVLGFVTNDSLGFLGLPGDVAVYLPQSYNFAGSLMIFPAEKVVAVDVDGSDVMAFLVSGGVSGAPGDTPGSTPGKPFGGTAGGGTAGAEESK